GRRGGGWGGGGGMCGLVGGARCVLWISAASPFQADFRQVLVTVTTLPVSSRLFRFDRIFGQPPDTASISFESGLSISCVSVSLTPSLLCSISIVQSE